MSKETKIDIGQRISEKDLCPEELLQNQIEAYMRDIKKLQRKKDSFVKVNCPACNSKHYDYEFKKYNFFLKKSKIFLIIFMSPRPTSKIMAEYYSNSENYQYWSKYIFPLSDKVRKNHIQKLWYSRSSPTRSQQESGSDNSPKRMPLRAALSSYAGPIPRPVVPIAFFPRARSRAWSNAT